MSLYGSGGKKARISNLEDPAVSCSSMVFRFILILPFLVGVFKLAASVNA